MRKILRALKLFLAAVLVLVVGLGIWGWTFVRSSLPAYGDSLALPALDAEVTIYRDQYGVPHIFAQTVHDLFFAQGYVQAQDRLWEMDLSRRAVQGRLAEIFGADYVDADHFLRTIGFYRAAESSQAEYPAEALAIAQAYADGVNAFLAREGRRLPIEFTILGYEPEPWTVTDSAAIGKYMAWVLGANLEAELFHLMAQAEVGMDLVVDLFPVYPADGPVTTEVPFTGWGNSEGGGVGAVPGTLGYHPGELGITPEAVAGLLEVIAEARLGLGPAESLGLGSNNWVVGGEHSTSGKPLLADDMHLEIKAPAIWYLNHLVCPGEFNVTGAIFPGIPGVIVGHNEHIAWGVTNVGPDVQDLYLERPNPDNPYEFEYDGVYEPAQVYREEIRVKGQTEPVIREVVVTRHGPIISGVMTPKPAEKAEAEGDDAGGTPGDVPADEPAVTLPPLALRWTALDPTCELAAMVGFDRASNWEEFKAALELFEVPAQNFVFADIEGNIAYRASGLIPVRSEAAQQAGNGLLPVPGWDSDYEWAGYIPWDELPTLVNPPSGMIVTANNRVTADDYPHFISYAWSAPYRAAAIWQELLARREAGPLTLDDMQAIQNDVRNLLAPRVWPAVEALVAGSPGAAGTLSPLEQEAWDIVSAWAANDPHDTVDSAGAAIFHTFYFEALRSVFADELGDQLFEQFVASASPTNTLDALLLTTAAGLHGLPASSGAAYAPGDGPGAFWFDNATTAEVVEAPGETLAAAFQAAVAKLEAILGSEPADWQWGEVHTVTFDHPMGSVGFIRPFVNRGPFPSAGSGITPAAKGFGFGDPPFAVESGAPWRFVVDLGDLAHARDVLAIGQSGQPLSPHYADQAPLWLEGRYKEMPFERAEIEALPGVTVTVLTPGG